MNIKLCSNFLYRLLILYINTLLECCQCNQSVKCSTIEQVIANFFCKKLTQGSFAGTAGAIDCDDRWCISGSQKQIPYNLLSKFGIQLNIQCAIDRFTYSDRIFRLGDRTANDQDRKSTRLNSSHVKISYAVFC